jgi:hypothetical protein
MNLDPMHICSEGKELRYRLSGNQIGGQFGLKQLIEDLERISQLSE